MTNCRFTIKCPKLAKTPAIPITPDDEKTLDISEIQLRRTRNNSYNKRAIELGDILQSKLTGVDITWCNDGCAVISCSNTLTEVEKIIGEEGLEIQPDRSTIRHKIKLVDPTNPAGESHQDIDLILEPRTIGETKLLKETVRENKLVSRV